MKNLKNQKGITLVALVVTIIVLLILAGVSLSLVAGSDGILGKATNAVDKHQIATIKEKIELKIAEEVENFYEAKYVDRTADNATTALEYISATDTFNDTTNSGAATLLKRTQFTEAGATYRIVFAITGTGDAQKGTFYVAYEKGKTKISGGGVAGTKDSTRKVKFLDETGAEGSDVECNYDVALSGDVSVNGSLTWK